MVFFLNFGLKTATSIDARYPGSIIKGMGLELSAVTEKDF